MPFWKVSLRFGEDRRWHSDDADLGALQASGSKKTVTIDRWVSHISETCMTERDLKTPAA